MAWTWLLAASITLTTLEQRSVLLSILGYSLKLACQPLSQLFRCCERWTWALRAAP